MLLHPHIQLLNIIITLLLLFLGCFESTCVLRLGSFWVVNTNLQVEELHNLLFESSTGPHICPDVQYRRQKLLTQLTYPHPTVNGCGSQEDVESRDEVLENSQVFLLPSRIIGFDKRKQV